MKVVALRDEEAMSRAAARLVADAVSAGDAKNLLLAMGRSPLRVYSILAESVAAGKLATGGLTIVQLDEYWDLGHTDERLLARWLEETVVGPWRLRPGQVLKFDVGAADAWRACADHEGNIAAAGGIDLAVLGIGPNGHLGFNEPPSTATSTTRPVELTPSSVRSNGSYWGGDHRSPRKAVTVGMDVILAARQVVLVASGPGKRQVLSQALCQAPSPEVPASYLQTHPNVTVFADYQAWEPEKDEPSSTTP